MSGAGSGFGYMGFMDGSSEYNRAIFQHHQSMSRVRTMMPVKIIKVYKQDKSDATQGDVAAAGFVDVQPLVSQMDGRGQRMDHETIYHIPYTRLYGGSNAVIMDPLKGDMGFIQASDRDISSFKENAVSGSSSGNPALPGSRRRHDFADSIYTGGLLSKSPVQYITFTSDSVTITAKSGNKIVLDKNGNVQVIPGGGGLVFLGGTGSDGSYDFVSTVSGPSSNVKAKK